MSRDEEKKRVRRIIADLQRYIGTYHEQALYDEYSDLTIIDDVLYGLGIALKPTKYKYAEGYDKFKAEVLRPHLEAK